MKLRLLSASLLLACSLAHAAAEPSVPKPLEAQVARLVELFKDSFATGYPEATRVQVLKTGEHSELILSVFTIEGFDMGNNYSQYLAIFTRTATEEGQEHYGLVDAMAIGGDGWRMVDTLQAKLVSAPGSKPIRIDLPVMENTADDSPNFPSRPGVVHLALEGSRLVEKK